MDDKPIDFIERKNSIMESQELAILEVELQSLRKKEKSVNGRLEAFRFMLKGIQADIIKLKEKLK